MAPLRLRRTFAVPGDKVDGVGERPDAARGEAFRSLAVECRRHELWFRQAVQGDALLSRYGDPAAVVGALSRRSPLAMCERNALIFALVCAHRVAPHPVWQGILAQAFEPMIARLLRSARGASGRELFQQIILCFLEAIVRAGREGRSDRIALRLRELTQRALFRFLQQELRHAVVATLLRERPCMTALPGPMELSEVSLPSDPVLRASLRAMERGGLRDLVRGENALVPRFELERIYRRTQRRRHRFVRALRRQAAVDALLCAVAQGSAP